MRCAAIAAAICRSGGARSRRGLREGAVRAVVSTNALELGIDIGALDVAVMAGYPGTIAATWQRAGRAGRRAGRSAAVLVASAARRSISSSCATRLLLRRVARARAHQSRQPAHPARSRQMRGLRAAVRDRRTFGRRRRAGDARRPRGSRGSCTSDRERTEAVALDDRVVSGRRGEPALRLVRQFRRHRRRPTSRG